MDFPNTESFGLPLATPLPSADAIKLIRSLSTMPTIHGSAGLSSLPSDIRKLALFSARTNSAAYLEYIRTILLDYSSGKINMATAVMKCQEWLKEVGYSPEKGFPSGQASPPGEGGVPPASSLLQNLASSPRLKLVVETLARHALNTAYMQTGQTTGRLYNWPAWELVRLYYRKHPRGSTDRDSDLSWQERWVQCGGKLYDGDRMIATKDDDIWDELGDSGKFSDGMDSDVPPFWFNSGGGVREVDRETCIALGVIDAGYKQEARKIDLLGQMFGDPAKATLSDINTKRNALLDALNSFKEAA